MNLYQCQEAAKKIGYDRAKFVALFPCGLVECQWSDAYMGILRIDVDGLRDGFVMVKQIDEAYPDLLCSDPVIPEQEPT